MFILIDLNNKISKDLEHPITFEGISHRYTIRAKKCYNRSISSSKNNIYNMIYYYKIN